MVIGLACRASSRSDHRKKNPARYWATSTATTLAAANFAAGGARRRLARGEPAALALRIEPDLSNETLMALHPKLDDDVDEEVKETLDVLPRKLRSALALLNKEHELLKRQL